MEISEIKARLTIETVLAHYALALKKEHVHCPFHEDKTPSMRVYKNTNTVFCFSGNCNQGNKVIDVIDFILHKENCTKHEAILKAKSLLGVIPAVTNNLSSTFKTLENQLARSKNALVYLQKRGLSGVKEIGSNHRNGNNNIAYKYEKLKNCIVFPLKNKEDEIVGLYGRSFKNEQRNAHYYLSNRTGLYPGYPPLETTRLILTESIIDAATLQRHLKLGTTTKILACYGTNGFTKEHTEAVNQLKKLETIIIFFDGDTAGKKAADQLQQKLKSSYPHITIKQVQTPAEEDINSLWQNHEDAQVFSTLLAEAQSLKTIAIPAENVIIPQQKIPIQKVVTIKQAVTTTPVIAFLKEQNLLKRLNYQIGKAGIVGEEKSRLLLFLITISYLNKKPVHGIVQGSSGSGKTHAIQIIANMMPQEDVLRFTRITESSLYNYGEFDLVRKIVIIEDLDGLKEDALYALRELISNQSLSSLTSIKDKKGNAKGKRREVKGQFSSLSATTKGELYEDNMNRSFIIAIDESEKQTQKIIDYQNQRIAGEVNQEEEKKARHLINRLVRSLKHYEVQNPYASKIQLPNNVRNKRRLNEMFQGVIKQITLLNQYQRKQTKDHKLLTEIEDIENAIEILFESIVLKADELDGSLRQFFEKLKTAFKDRKFSRFEAMAVTGLKKSQLQVYLNELIKYEYLKQQGFANKGYQYKVGYYDNSKLVRDQLKAYFKKQIAQLKPTTSGS